jgi:hypothetical protein
MSDFVKNSSESIVIVINAPHRHDLIPNSCVNKEVAKYEYNRLMKKVVKQNPNIQLLELELDRSHFMNHGMHVNSKGKDQASQHLANLIDLITDIPQPPPIPIPWEPTTPDLNNTDPYQDNTEGNTIQHRRKCPRMKDPDFLWTYTLNPPNRQNSLG